MNLSSYIKLSSEFKPLEYLLTLPPMSKIKGIGEDNEDFFEIFGKKGLYDFAGKENLTIKELIDYLPSKNSKYKFEIEFEKEDRKDDWDKAITLRKIYDRTKNSEILKELLPLEKEIAKNAENSCEYAKEIGKRFELGEPIIAKDAREAYEYSLHFGRFPQGEPAIAKDPQWAALYSLRVLKRRFPQGEPAIAKDVYFSNMYAKFVIKNRFIMAEPILQNNPVYLDFLKELKHSDIRIKKHV